MSTETIWNEFSKRLEMFILSRVNDAELAKDLLQEIFVKIHLKNDSLKDDAKLKSWLFQITRNAIIDHYRKKKIQTNELVENLETPSEELIDQEEHYLQKCLEPYIAGLPNKYRYALEQTAFENISQKELALKESISYTAAKSRVQRARQMIKKQIVDCCNPTTDAYGNLLDKEPCKNDCGCED